MNPIFEDKNLARLLADGDILKNLALGPWSRGIDVAADGPISWRNHVAAMLHGVDGDPVLDGMGPLLDAMAGLTADVFIAQAEQGGPRTIEIWYEIWREHFTHWHDPVRQLLAEHIEASGSGDAQYFGTLLGNVNGLVLLDWLLATREALMHQRALADALFGREAVVEIAERPPEIRAINWHVVQDYKRCLASRGVQTVPAPDDFAVALNYDRLDS